MGIKISSNNFINSIPVQSNLNNENKVVSEIENNPVTELPDSKLVNISCVPKYAHVISHRDDGGTLVFGYMPDYYTKLVSREFVGARPEREVSVLGKKKIIPAVPPHWEETRVMLPSYHIDKICSTGKGSGTNSIKSIVKKSLQDSETQGRVTLDASCIDGKTSPAGFYYKLGFRFKDDQLNNECQQWLENGGDKSNAPFLSGIMFLPKENISHCLNYQ